MSSILDDIEVILANGDIEVFKQWVEAKFESKDRQIAHLLHRIQNIEKTLDILECKIEQKLDKVQFDYEITMRDLEN